MKEDDPFDLDKLRASPEIVEAKRQKGTGERRAKTAKRQKDVIFIRLPMPWDRLLWGSKCRFTSRVLNYLIERQFKQRAKSQPIPVSNVEMEKRNVSRGNKERALRELEAFGICTVERRSLRRIRGNTQKDKTTMDRLPEESHEEFVARVSSPEAMAKIHAKIEEGRREWAALSEPEKDRRLAAWRLDEQLVEGFRPTDQDLLAIVRYRRKEWLGIRFNGQAGTEENCIVNWATRRIRQIAELLGDELVAEAVGQADDEFWRRYDPEIRRLFETDMPKFRAWQIAELEKMLAAGSESQIH